MKNAHLTCSDGRKTTFKWSKVVSEVIFPKFLSGILSWKVFWWSKMQFDWVSQLNLCSLQHPCVSNNDSLVFREKPTSVLRSYRGLTSKTQRTKLYWNLLCQTKKVKASMGSENITSLVSSVHCSPWVDYVESVEGESTIGLVIFVNCVATILANSLLLLLICSHKESKDQVRWWFMLSIGWYLVCWYFVCWYFVCWYFLSRGATCSCFRLAAATSCLL